MGKFYIIYGENELAVKKRSIALARELAFSADNSATNDELSSDECSTEIIVGDNLTLEETLNSLISELQTPPFLTPFKTVFLRYFKDIDKLINPTSPLGEKLFSMLLEKNYDENINLIIESPEGVIDLRKANSKKIKAVAVLENFEAIKITDKKYQEMKSLIISDYVKSNGKNITPDAVKFLCEVLPNDNGVIENEIEKLIIYLGEEHSINLEICKQVCAKTPESLIYLFTGALMEKNLATSIKLLDVLIDNGEVEMKIMTAISNEVQKIVQTRLAMQELQVDKNLHPRTFDNIDATLKNKYPKNFLLGLHPYRAFKVCESALSWDKNAIAHAIKCTAQANLAIVSGKTQPRTVLEQLIFNLCK